MNSFEWSHIDSSLEAKQKILSVIHETKRLWRLSYHRF